MLLNWPSIGAELEHELVEIKKRDVSRGRIRRRIDLFAYRLQVDDDVKSRRHYVCRPADDPKHELPRRRRRRPLGDGERFHGGDDDAATRFVIYRLTVGLAIT